MKKILIRNNLVNGGGVENVLYNLVHYLVHQGYKVTVVSDQCNRAEFYRLYPEVVRYYRKIRFSDRGSYHSLKWLITGCVNKVYKAWYKLLLKMHHDVVIAMKEGPCMKEVLNANADKKFAWVHVDYTYMHWTSCCFKTKEEERACMQKFDRVICVSQATADAVINTIGDPGNLCVCYNPINSKQIIQLSKKKIEQKIITGRLTLISVGRLSHQKNYPLLLDVCAQLQKKYDFELWIIGDGPDRMELEKQIIMQNINCVKLMGSKNNPYPFIRLADCFVSSSTWESYGLAVQEALVLGIPIVAVTCPAIEEVCDRKYGLLVDNSFQGLYSGIEKILTDENFRKQCHNNIVEDYSRTEMYERRLQKIRNLWE